MRWERRPAAVALWALVGGCAGIESAGSPATSEPPPAAVEPAEAESAGPAPVDVPAPVPVPASASASVNVPDAPDPVPEPPEPEPAFEPQLPWLARGGPTRVLIIGDSMAATDFGRELGAYLQTHADVVVRRRGKSSSGLARPDFFDWFEEGARLAARHRPDLVVVVIGGNDGQDLRPKAPGTARWVHWRSERWPEIYRTRTLAFLDGMAAKDRRFVWVELPAMAHRRLEGKLELIRAVQSEALAEREDVLAEVPGAPCFYEEDRLLSEVPAGPDAGEPMRLPDGIHFTLAGARHYAACVGPVLAEFLPPPPPDDPS